MGRCNGKVQRERNHPMRRRGVKEGGGLKEGGGVNEGGGVMKGGGVRISGRMQLRNDFLMIFDKSS